MNLPQPTTPPTQDVGEGIALRLLAFIIGAPCLGLGILWLTQPLDKGHIGRGPNVAVLAGGAFFVGLALMPGKTTERVIGRIFAAGALAAVAAVIGAVAWSAVKSVGRSGFCSSHSCIGNFDQGNGYIVQCADGMWSHSGGEPGACSDHGGEG